MTLNPADFQVAVSLGGGSALLIGEQDARRPPARLRHGDDPTPCRTQGLVQLRVVNLDEDVDTQETSCYVHEGLLATTTFEIVRKCACRSGDREI